MREAAVDLCCVRRPPGPVDGQHQLCVQALAQRKVRSQLPEPRAGRLRPIQQQIGLGAVLLRQHLQLGEPSGRRPGEVLVGELRVRRALPPAQRLVEALGSRRGIIGELRPSRDGQILEPQRIQTRSVEPQAVAGGLSQQLDVLGAGGAQHCPQARYQIVQGAGRESGLPITPQAVRKPVCRRKVIHARNQDGQQAAHLTSPRH